MRKAWLAAGLAAAALAWVGRLPAPAARAAATERAPEPQLTVLAASAARAPEAAGGSPSAITRPGALPVAEPGAPLDDARLLAVREAARDPSPRGTAVLMKALEADDDIARIEAIDALVERKHAAALPRLLALDPAAEPDLAPTVIAALGALGRASSDARARDAALGRLVTLLAEEKDRRGADSAGNIVAIIEALGVLRHPGGAPVLERELLDPSHDTADRTAIVQSLAELGQRSSLPVLERLRAATAAAPPAEDELGRALDAELLSAIDEATRTLAR